MWIRIAALLLPLALATAASAADVCFYDSTNQAFYRFRNLKVPKKSGDVVPLVGQAFTATSANALPLAGTLIRDANTGNLLLGFTRYFQECIIGAALNETLDGTISYDCNLDGANDGTVALSFVPGCVL
jgi:hypothetical protein